MSMQELPTKSSLRVSPQKPSDDNQLFDLFIVARVWPRNEVVVVVVVEERGDGGIARWRKTERKERKRRERESENG
jgi:hypothetical protein